MNFLNNPEYSSIKVFLTLALVVGTGVAVYHFGGNSGFTGRALNTRTEGEKQSLTENTNDPQFFSSPTILSIIPNVGPTTGGATVTITGTSFSPDIVATIDSLPCTNLEYINDTTIKCKTPPHGIDLVDVTITEATGTATLPDGYQYIDAPVTAGGIITNNTNTSTISTTGTTSTSSKKPKVSWDSVGISVNEGAFIHKIKAIPSFSINEPITVPFTVSTGTNMASNPADYTIVSSPITIPANATFAYVDITIKTDTFVEPDESITLTMGTPSTNATLGSPTVNTTVIHDPYSYPVVSFESDKGIHEDAGTFTVTATLSFTSNLPVTVPFTIASTSTAGNPADYSLTSANPLIIPANEPSGSISFKVINDTSYENDESVMLTMGTPVNATPGDTTHTTMIDDNDVPPTVQWTVATQSGNENVGTMKITAISSATAGVPITVPFTVMIPPSTALNPADYTISTSPITIPANEPSYFSTIYVVDDLIDEPDETVIVKMDTANIVNATPGNITIHTAVIVDNDMPCTTNTWTQKADFGGSGRFDAVGFSIDDKGYIGLGYDGGSYKKDFWEYDPATNTWTQKADFGGGIRTTLTGFSIDLKGYVGAGSDGGSYKKDFWEYDPATNTWTQKADFGGGIRLAPSSFSVNGKGYMGTGVNPIDTKDFWEYDPSNNSWTQRADFGGAARRWVNTGFSVNGKGYMGTGYGGGLYKKDFWEYDPSNNSWTQRADFGGSARAAVAGFSINQKGYIGTGRGTVQGPAMQDFWEYNPSTNIWTQKADFGGGSRYSAVGFSIDGRGYIGTGAGSIPQKDFWEYCP